MSARAVPSVFTFDARGCPVPPPSSVAAIEEAGPDAEVPVSAGPAGAGAAAAGSGAAAVGSGAPCGVVRPAPRRDLAPGFNGFAEFKAPIPAFVAKRYCKTYFEMSKGVPELSELSSFCGSLSSYKDAAQLFAATLILSIEDVPDAVFKYREHCSSLEHLFFLEAEDLKELIEIARKYPKWEGSDHRGILKNPKGAAPILLYSLNDACKDGNQNRALIHLAFFQALPDALAQREIVKQIGHAMSVASNPHRNIAYFEGKLLQEFLDFFASSLPRNFDDGDSLFGIADIFAHSSLHGKGNFDRIFSFLKSRTDILETEVMQNNLAAAISKAAVNSYPYRDQTSTPEMIFKELASFIRVRPPFSQMPILCKALGAQMSVLRQYSNAPGSFGPANRHALELLQPIYDDLMGAPAGAPVAEATK